MTDSTNNSKKILLAAVAAGIIGFAGYGSYNIAQAITGLDSNGTDQNNTVVTTIPAATAISPDGTPCSPYGCAGCSGCTAPLETSIAIIDENNLTEEAPVY